MLQSIREHTQGWIAGTIISLIILSFALWGIHSYIVNDSSSSVVAEINGVEISKEQLTLTYERMRRQAEAQYGLPVSGKEDAALRTKALQSLIDTQVLSQASIQQGFNVFNRQIDNYLQSMPEFQVDGQFSVTRFQEILSATLMSISDFLDLIKTSLIIEQPRLGILLTSFAVGDETTDTLAIVNQERDVSYLDVPLTHFTGTDVAVSDADIAAYYNKHQKDFMTKEQMNVEYLQLSPSVLAANFNPADDTLKSFYSENINAYTLPSSWKLVDVIVPVSDFSNATEVAAAKSKADAVVTGLKNGIDPKTFAKDYKSKNLVNQGLLTLNQIPVELQSAVSELAAVNQVSQPIKTPDGFVVLKALDHKAPSSQTFDAVKDRVKETYIKQHSEDKFTEIRDQLADLTYEHPESLETAAKALNLPVQTSELFTKDKAGKDISQFKQVRDTAFSNDVLNLKNNSDVIQLNPETVIVIRIKTHIASSLLPLKAVSAQIADKLKTAAAEAKASHLADDLLQKLKASGNASALATQQLLTWHDLGMTGRYATKVDTAILDTAFRMPHPNESTHEVVYGKARTPTGYAIVALKAVKNGTAGDTKEENVFSEQVQNSIGMLEYELYKRSQIQQAKIEVTK